jgi:hypothetical protein
LTSVFPSTSHCTTVQIVSMMKYGSRMSVITRFIPRLVGGPDFVK